MNGHSLRRILRGEECGARSTGRTSSGNVANVPAWSHAPGQVGGLVLLALALVLSGCGAGGDGRPQRAVRALLARTPVGWHTLALPRHDAPRDFEFVCEEMGDSIEKIVQRKPEVRALPRPFAYGFM